MSIAPDTVAVADFWLWVPDRRWRTPSVYSQCRRIGPGYIRCTNRPAADLKRSRDGSYKPRWWGYCADHLYGRRVVDGVVLIAVHPESPAAKRGYDV